MSDPPRLHRSGDGTPSASAPPLSSSRLLRSIEETSDLLRSFRTLKERGATREELAALHTRVRLLKEAQVRAAYDAPAAPALAVSSTGQSQRSNAVDGVLTRDGAVAGLNTSSAPHGSQHHAHRQHHQQQRQQPAAAASASQQPPTHPSLPAHHVDPTVPVAQHIPPPPPSSWSASRPSDYRQPPQSLPLAPQAAASTPLLSSTAAAASVMPSVVFAIVLAESHTRREVAHKWERRLLRLWAAFREERVAIALRPTTGQQWLPIRGDDEGGRTSAHAAYAQGLAPQLLQERGRQGQSTATTAADASPLAGAIAAVSAPITSSKGSQDKGSTQQAAAAQQLGGGPDVSSPSFFSSCAPPVPGPLSPDGQHAGALMSGATKPPPTVFDMPAPQPVLASPGTGQGGRHALLPVPTPPAFTPAPTRTDEALLEAQSVERERKEREAAVAAESERARRQREAEEEETAAAERQEARRRQKEAAALRAAAACNDHLQQERADRHAVTESEGTAWRSLRDAARSSLRAAVEATAAREEEAARQQRAKDAAAARQQLTEGEHAARQRTRDEEDASRALLQHSEAEGRAAARARTEERRRVEAEAERAAAAESERQRRAAAEKEKEKEAARERELEEEKAAREQKARAEAEEEQTKLACALHSEKASLTRQLQDVTNTLLTALVKEAVAVVAARAAAEEQKAKEEAEAKARQEREEEEERQRAAAAAKEAEEEVAAQARRDVEAAEEGSRLLMVVDEETAHEQLERVAEASKAAAAAAAMKRKGAEEEKTAQAEAQEEEQRAAAAAASAAAAFAASQQQLKQESIALLEGVCRTLLDEVVRDAAEAVEEKKRAAAAQAAADAAEEKRLREEEEREKQKEEERRRAEAQREEEAAAAATEAAAAAAAAAQKAKEDEEKERETTRHAAEAAARPQQERQRAAAVAEHCALLATVAASLVDEWIAESAEAVTAQAAQFSADVMRLCDSEGSARTELVTAALAAATVLASQHEQEVSALRCIAEEAAALPESHGEKDHALLVEASNPDSSTTAQTNAKAGVTAKTVESSSSSSSSSDATASVPSSASFLPTPDAATPSLVQSRATPDSFLHVADGFLADLLHDAAVEATETMFQQLPEKERGHAEELEGSEMRTPRRGMVKLLDAVLTDQDTAKRVREEGETEAAAAGGGGGEEGGVGRGSPESASTMPSPSERTCTSNASSPCSVPPRAEPPAPLTPHAAVAAAAAAAAAASAKPRKASPLSERAEAAGVTPQAAEDRHQQEEKETRGREGSVGDHAAAADPVSSPAREGSEGDNTSTLCEDPLLQPDQQRSFQAVSDSLRAVTTMPTAFSASPPRSLSSSTPRGHHDEEETPNAAVRGVRQPLNLTPPPDRDLSPLLANAVDSPNSHAQAQQHEQQPANSASAEPQGSGRLASVGTDKANVNGGVSPPLGPVPAGACAGDGSGAASRRGSAGELDMSASALDEGLRALSLDAPSVPPFRLESAAPPHSPPEGSQSDLQAALSVEKLEAASASMLQALIHDAVRLLPAKSSYGVAPLTTAIATTPPRDLERFDAHVGERHLSPSLSSERLHSLSPSHSDSMHPPSPTHLTVTVAAAAAGGLTAATGSSSSSSGAATPPPAAAHASAGVVSAAHSGGDGLSAHGEGSEKHTDRRHSISELGHGFTRSDAQEALPLSPSSSPTAPPSLPSPAAAAAAVVTAGATKSGPAHEARMDLASLSTLVTAVATPNDFIAQLRQQEAAKRAAAHLQNRYLTPRELAAEAADFLTSPAAAALVTDVGPVEALTTRAVALVLAMGLVRRATLANRRARRRVERAKAAAAASSTQPDEHQQQQQQTKNGSSPKSAGEQREGIAAAAATVEDDAVARAGGFDAIHSPCDNPEEAFPTGAVHTDVEDEEEEGMIAPASPSLGGRHGTHGFGAAAVAAPDSDVGSFPSGFPTTGGPSGGAGGSGDHQGSEDGDGEDDPYSSAAVAPSVMSPSAHFPSFASSTAAAAAGAKRAGPLLSPPVDSISAEGAAADTSKGEDGEGGRTLPGQGSAAKLPVEWDAALRAVAERIAGDLMDYASRRLLLGQGEGQSNQDHLRTAEKLHEDAVAAVDVSLLFTRELRLRDVARLTLYYLELAANGTRDRTDPHYAPTALGEHNMFGRRSSGDNDGEEEEKGSPPWVVAVGAHDGEGSRAAGSSSALCAPVGSSSSTLFSPRLHPRNDTFLTAATAIHVRRSGLMQLVLEQCIANVMDDLVGDTVGWLGTSYLPACAAAAAAPTPKRRKRSS